MPRKSNKGEVEKNASKRNSEEEEEDEEQEF